MMHNIKKKKTEKVQHSVTDPGNILILFYLACILFFLLLGSLSQAHAEGVREEKSTLFINDVRRGELLLPTTTPGRYRAVPLLNQKVGISINGITAKLKILQRFENKSNQWVEAVYAFPLPEDSAITTLRMKIGERSIEGTIQEKEQAKKTYEAAKREGKKTSLLSQKRPNIFTTSVANIGPGEKIDIFIEYQQVVRLTDGVFSLRFPMVIAPRYIPGKPIAQGERSLSFNTEGWAKDTDQVPDASQITPHVIEPGQKKSNPVEMSVELSAGFALASVKSLYHGMDKEETDEGVVQLSFNGEVKADRDFVLEWRAKEKEEVQGAFFSETRDKSYYSLLMVMPPGEKLTPQRIPREMIFVLDTSGSMAGTSIVQAKKALHMAISRLDASDRFNLIEFNDKARTLFGNSQPGDQENREQALNRVERLEAEGGTEMTKALNLALNGKSDNERLRQVVFLTDGSVGNEEQLFELIVKRLGDSRLFTVGIGSAPNSFFMTRAASMGRGTFTYIGKVEEVQEKMNHLFQKLERPAVTDLHLEGIQSKDLQVEMYPSLLPDLYTGEPLVVSLKTKEPLDKMILSGRQAGKEWSLSIEAGQKKLSHGVATLWARKKIKDQMAMLSLGKDEKGVKTIVLATALEHHLVSKYTSLVAVEKKPSRPQDRRLVSSQIKTNLPSGWKYGKVFGGASQTATPATLHLLFGALMLILALLFLGTQRRRGI